MKKAKEYLDTKFDEVAKKSSDRGSGDIHTPG